MNGVRHRRPVSDGASWASSGPSGRALASVPDVVEEMVVLLDEQRRSIGAVPKVGVHHAATPLHLGFSCYVLDPAGRVLVTQRALDKRSFGGVWTNAFCGHPAPGEDPADAVRRRADFELGITVREVTLALPDFRYRAEQDGVVENEWCPVFLAVTDDDPTPEPEEVAELRWTTWEQLQAELATDPEPWSPWCREQAPLLAGLVEEFRARL